MSHLKPLRVLVWNENVHERTQEDIRAIYPEGIHGAIAAGLNELFGSETFAGILGGRPVEVATATLDEPEHGLSEERLATTDVLLWWGHIAHDQVEDAIVERVHRAVLGGMGLIVLHSGHYSKIFKRLMGTTCSLGWRNDGESELVWTVAPEHPIAAGVPSPIRLEKQEMYSEYFDVPAPDELVFISSFDGGEVFRGGLAYTRGHGKVFYFSPGDQEYPVYFHPDIRRVLANAVLWAEPTRPLAEREPDSAPNVPRTWR